MELRKEVNFDEFDRGLEEVYRSLNKQMKDLENPEANPGNRPPKKIKVNVAAKVHYEKDDLLSFHDLMLSRPLVKACNVLEYDHPTRIQSQVVPNILENRDLLVNAVTGSGKTASYLLPILEKLHRRDMRTSKVSNSKLPKTRILIMQPTRELAAQCSSMLENLSKFVVPRITYATVIGGSSLKKQESELVERPDIIIATPGRLLDIIMNSKNIFFNNIECVILDEADKLLEMGFQEMIEELLKHFKKDSDVENIQTLLFSATLTKEIKRLASLALRDPLMISEVKQQNSVNAYLKLSHYIVQVPNIERNENKIKEKKEKKEKSKKKKNSSDSESEDADMSESEDEEKPEKDEKTAPVVPQNLLMDKLRVQKIRESIVLSLVMKTFTKKTIIFTNTKSQCHRLYALFTLFGLKAAEVQGNLNQRQRMESVEKFQNDEVDFLIATDLLGRGLDIYNVQAVINFEFPNEENRYVHRVGRTARAGNTGVAITLCNENEKNQTQKVAKKCKGTAKSYSVSKQLKEPLFTLINLLNEGITKLLHDEREEFQLERAETDLKRAQNILEYQDEIYNRPKKEWFQSAKQKIDANKQGKQEMKDREFTPMTREKDTAINESIIRKKKKMIAKIKGRKRELREQEKRHMKFDKRQEKRIKKGGNKRKAEPAQQVHKEKKPKSKMVHGKHSLFTQEI